LNLTGNNKPKNQEIGFVIA